jgi:hypothetical protein
MGDVIAIVAPFFSTPTSYAQMLKKLSGFAFWEMYFITFLLRGVPAIGNSFRSLESSGSFSDLFVGFPILTHINATGFAIALLGAILSHAVLLHDRLSDALRIRHRFDQRYIIFPLANLVGVSLSTGQKERIALHRDGIMRSIFYQYASSRSDDPIVDKHDIQHALSAWAWFWVCVEAAFFFAFAALIAWYFAAYPLSIGFSGSFLIFIALGFLQHGRLPRYARPQIEAIAANAQAASHVSSVLRAL